jgi:predicted metal-dependent enzyme (double-stranded beta helix superfamily)
MTRRQLLTAAGALAVAPGGAGAPWPTHPARPPCVAGGSGRFDLEGFVGECRRARAGTDAHAGLHEVMVRAICDPQAVLRALGEPQQGGIRTLYHAPELTILNIVWSPLMQLLPHEHRMWSVIGIYTGREDNIFWQRRGESLEATGARAIAAGRAVSLPEDVIHSVANPIAKYTGAIHVYGGDFFATARSEWDPETLTARAWNLQQAVRIFRDANERFAAWQGRACS